MQNIKTTIKFGECTGVNTVFSSAQANKPFIAASSVCILICAFIFSLQSSTGAAILLNKLCMYQYVRL